MSSPKTILKKVAILFAVGVVGTLIVVAVTFYISYIRSVPQTSGSINVAGLENTVEILFDQMGIPQIYAESEADGYFALGYQHAADRMFQMDLVRHLAQGRLSEMLGPITVEPDISLRIIGHNRIARDAEIRLAEVDRSRLQAYSDGVNAYANSCSALPFEYRLLPIGFETWSVYDCLTILSFQTWFSDALQNRDEFFAKLALKVGEKKARTLDLPYPDWAPTTVIEGGRYGNLLKGTLGDSLKNAMSDRYSEAVPEELRTQVLWPAGFDPCRFPQVIQRSRQAQRPAEHERKAYGTASSHLPDSTARVDTDSTHTAAVTDMQRMFQQAVADQLFAGGGLPFTLTTSSNAWAVAPSRSTSGRAMLASDPHLEVSRLPQFWYYVGLHIKQTKLDLLGITTPGLPFEVMGHNGKAAWAFTAGGVDITDFYKETFKPDDSEYYMTPDGPQQFREINELISIAGEDTALSLQIKISRHGPLVEVAGPLSCATDTDSLAATYALRWAGFDRDLVDAASAGFRLHEVSNFEQFRRIVTSLGALDANWIYADSSGHIGYQLGTPVPVRPGRWGNFPVNGSTDKFEWQGYLPLDATPHEYDPQRGWLTSNNNAPRRDIDGNYAADRILRITQLMEGSKFLTVTDLQAMQMDQTDIYLLRWKDEVVRLLKKCDEPDRAAIIESWNGNTAKDSWSTHFMNVFLSHLTKLTFGDELGGLTRNIRKIWMDQVYNSTDSLWFDDINTPDVIEKKEQVAIDAIKEAIVQTGDRTWGEVHSLTMRHPMSVVPLLGDLLGLIRGPWSRSGTAGTLCASFFRENNDGMFEDFVAPSWRFVIDFADVDAATIVLPAGNSGNPASDHFFDFNDIWQTGERWNVPISREKVGQRAVETLLLHPVSGLE